MDVAVAVEHYKRNFQERARAELDSFRMERSLAAAVWRAALASTSDGKRYSHQNKLTRVNLRFAAEALISRLADVEAASNFGRLIELIDGLFSSRVGLGDLYFYDTALRIGAKLGRMPTRVYLHSGAAVGAKALGLRSKVVDVFELPSALRILEPYEIEDVLCIYKEYLAGGVKDLDEARACWPEDAIPED